MKETNFPAPDKKSINEQELDILKFWNDNQIFKKSVQSRSPKNEYVFYDGPPFATGMPHYGHFLASIIKDVVPRYQTMLGNRVQRVWGWDCHGLPIENIVENELGTKSKKDIEDKIGIDKFNEACRSKVLYFADEWERIIHRLGRWVDFENGYKTMDRDFMESVMWVFADLHKKKLIYEGRRISLYCPRCETPLSNFEIAMDNSYQMRHDQTATVKFELVDEANTYLLAWTTTPWTLPSNWGVAVNPELEYVMVSYCHKNMPKDGPKYENLILAKSIFENNFFHEIARTIHEEQDSVKLIQEVKTIKGSDLVGKIYKPLFPYFEGQKGLHQVHGADFVSDSDGTGIVHLAPYGEDDFNLAKEKGIDIIELETVDNSGNFKEIVKHFPGKFILDKDTNKEVNAWLDEKGLIFEKKQYSHNYPHCWRCETPLFYNPQRAYFLNVQEIKQKMLKNNKQINWEPNHIKTGRFEKGLQTAPDWNLSRNRFWGSPIPIWKCNNENCEHEKVIGSIAELEGISGEKVNDLHKHFVDKISFPCEKCGGTMNRTPEVLDCWFESGSMPYAQKHFPFTTKEKEFKNIFPGDFIAEYIAQTRGWFYTLHVLSTALFDSNSFKNVICTGTILAEDGNKMSKSKKNYPDPSLIFEKYGSDPMRYYLMSSSVMKGENFNFTEKGVAEILKTVILPLKSAYQFFSTYTNIDNWRPTKITFIRHGEGTHNVDGIYSGVIDNPHKLTEKGVADIENLKKELSTFDAIYASPFVRTQQTASILFGKDNYTLDKRLVEIDFGDLEGQKYRPVLERLKDKSGESLADIQKRMSKFILEIGKKHYGQDIAVVSHGGPIRYGRGYFSGHRSEETILNYHIVSPGEKTDFILPPNPQTELDRWIMSELQILLKVYREKMDSYKLDEALKPIPDFIDNLNNWFLRRSRKRFWAKEMTAEKISGYETLFHVLLTLSKILAPTCPFFAEKLFKDLTGFACNDMSVHLRYLPFADEDLIDENLSAKISAIREIVSLSAGIRARGKIKLRQPLGKLSFSVTNKIEFTDQDLQIIKEEANVKNIEILSEKEVSDFAKKIIKVDARKVGKKFGKKVQELIIAGKNGEFEILADGNIKIKDEILAPGEYEVSFVCGGELEADSTAQVVVLLQTEITENLRIEGISREIIRAIQEKRKSDGFEISDRIVIKYFTESEDLKQAFTQFGDKISQEVLGDSLSEKSGGDRVEIDGEGCELKIEKN